MTAALPAAVIPSAALPASALALPGSLAADLLAQCHDGVVAASPDGVVLSWNPSAERLLGWSAAEMLGQSLLRLASAPAVARLHETLAHAAAGGTGDAVTLEALHRNGSILDLRLSVAPVRDASGHLQLLAVTLHDQTEQVQDQRTLWLHAHFDPLTQLPNRRLLMEQLDTALRAAQRAGEQLAMLFFDLDRFKQINDSLGHAAGDALLVDLSCRVRRVIRSQDTVARMGGDEFVVLMPRVRNADEAMEVAARVQGELERPFSLRRDSVNVGCTIGAVVFPDDGGNASELFAHADLAMYEGKRLGRHRTVRFEPRLKEASRRRSRLLSDLHHAAERGQLRLEYQPVYRVDDLSIVKCEALLRWTHPELGAISPGEFIPLAEDSGLIAALGDWVFRTAAQQLQAWRAWHPELQMAVNVSVLQLRADDGRIARWPAYLREIDLPHQAMVAEITESVMLEGNPSTEASLRTLRAAGVEVAVDDFGIGFSCLASLDRMDVNCLKIDASFTRKLAPGARVVALCQAITAMAHALGLDVVIEGVETEGQLALVREIGCDLVQGFLLSRPLRPEVLEAQLRGSGLTVPLDAASPRPAGAAPRAG